MDAQFKARFETLRTQFATRMAADLADISDLMTAFTSDPTPEKLRDFRIMVHRYSGGGTSFGFPEVSRLAIALENILEEALAGPACLSHPAILHATTKLLHAMRQSAPAP